MLPGVSLEKISAVHLLALPPVRDSLSWDVWRRETWYDHMPPGVSVGKISAADRFFGALSEKRKDTLRASNLL